MTLDVSNATSIKLNGQDVTKISDGVNTLWELPIDDRNYMYLENTSNGVGTLTLSKTGTPNATELYYSLDKSNWSPFDLTQATNTVNVPSGGKVYFRGDNSNGFNATVYDRYTFSMNVSHIAGGDSRSLISATDFENVTTMPQGCYCQLFVTNTTITGASDLLFPFANVSQDGMRALFNGCTSLTSIPSLSTITSVGQDGLRYFAAGSRITSVDLSSVKSVGTTGFVNAFNGCSQLNNVKCMNLDSWDTPKMSGWLDGVAASGTFTKPLGLAILRGSANTIPVGWTLSHYFNEYYYLPFYLQNNTSSATTFKLTGQGGTTSNTKNVLSEIQYSFDNTNWTTLDVTSIQTATSLVTKTVNVPANGRIYLRGNNSNGLINPNTSSGSSVITNFQLGASYSIGGNILSLISKNFTTYTSTLPKYCFRGAFGGVGVYNSGTPNTNLKDASKLIIPVRNIGNGGLYGLFYCATQLTAVPDMTYINTVGTDGCAYMFAGKYVGGTTTQMNLVNGPDFSGTTTGNGMYCLCQYCKKITSITSPKISSWPSTGMNSWLSNVASSGKVYKPSTLTIPTSSENGVPSGWSTSNY